MFTGIVEEMGNVTAIEQVDGAWQMVIAADIVLGDAKLGDSIAVNGTCLTVTEMVGDTFRVGIAPETMLKTNLGDLVVGSPVNLERSMPASGRFDGHMVQGHVDGTGIIQEMKPDNESLVVTVAAAPELLRYIVKKGYVAIDGTSLTIVDVSDETFTFMLIAYTQAHIIIPKKSAGERINIEVDIVGKYIEKFLANRI